MAEEPQHVLRMCAESLLTAVARPDGTQTQSPLTGIETGRTIVNPPHPQQSPARLTSTTTRPTGNAAISSSSISGLAAPASAIDEHRRLFGYQVPSSSRTGTSSRGQKRKIVVANGKRIIIPVKKSWTRLFVCLSKTSAKEVPSAKEKISLSLAGLGEKKIVLNKDGKASHVYDKLLDEFPPLAEGGGFEILRTTEQSSKILTPLPIPPGGYAVPYLKSILGQARGFIRPLQKDLRLNCMRFVTGKFCWDRYSWGGCWF